MTISKHGYARFKQRLHIKNRPEMIRRARLAISRGIPVKTDTGESASRCYEFAGFRYIFAPNNELLITVYPIAKTASPNRDKGNVRDLMQNLSLLIEEMWAV